MLEHADEEEVVGGELVLVSVVLVLMILLSIAAERYSIPASAALLVLGMGVGGALRLTRLDSQLDLRHVVLFNEEIFLYALLPPVIFEAGFTLQKHEFIANIGTILLFAVGGTLLSTAFIGGVLYAVGSAGAFTEDGGRSDALDFCTPLDAFLFGGLISATDPVATLSIMGAVGVEPVVYALVFGESVLNDAVAIVLVRILQARGDDGFRHPVHFLPGIGQFLLVSAGSVAVGAAVSAASALLLKRMRRQLSLHAPFALSLLLLFGYASYCAAEAVFCSGIVALFVTGVLESHYHVHHLADSTVETARVALKSAAHLCEGAIFAYIGVSVASDGLGGAPEGKDVATADCGDADVANVASGRGRAGFVAFSVALVLLARVALVPPLCLLANLFRVAPVRRPVGGAMVLAGLRGAIAFALAKNVRSVHRANIAAATTAVVLFTTFVLGAPRPSRAAAHGVVM